MMYGRTWRALVKSPTPLGWLLLILGLLILLFAPVLAPASVFHAY
jgi:hypothetical protein